MAQKSSHWLYKYQEIKVLRYFYFFLASKHDTKCHEGEIGTPLRENGPDLLKIVLLNNEVHSRKMALASILNYVNYSPKLKWNVCHEFKFSFFPILNFKNDLTSQHTLLVGAREPCPWTEVKRVVYVVIIKNSFYKIFLAMYVSIMRNFLGIEILLALNIFTTVHYTLKESISIFGTVGTIEQLFEDDDTNCHSPYVQHIGPGLVCVKSFFDPS